MHYFSQFYTKFYKPCDNFSQVWTKNTNCWEICEKILKNLDENSLGKLNFIRLQQFFPFRGGLPGLPLDYFTAIEMYVNQ